MTFSSPISSTLFIISASVVTALALGAYILRMHRRPFEVPFSMLWQRVLKERQTTTWWRRLRRLLSLLLQMAILFLLFFAILDPHLGQSNPHARNVVLIIDMSASMKSEDVSLDGMTQPRIALAKRRALNILENLGSGDAAMIMRMDSQTTPLSRFTRDKDLLKSIIQNIRPTDTQADLLQALRAAADALQDRPHPNHYSTRGRSLPGANTPSHSLDTSRSPCASPQ